MRMSWQDICIDEGSRGAEVRGLPLPPNNVLMHMPAADTPPTRIAPADTASRTWSGVAATKFRAPRQRRDLVLRSALLQRARGFALDRRVTLICAPAGFGKSTTLLQLLTATAADAESAWLSLDEDDNDINRLFVSLLGALREVALEWEVDPHILASQVQVSGPQSRAAIAALINALSSYQGERLLLVIDDLHRVSDADALQLLGEFIERLPPEVGVVLGSRISPALPLARWRARGEVGELLMADLQFDANEARALASVRQLAGLSGELSAEFLEQALQRTQGWAAGLQLVLGAIDSHAVESMRPAVDRAAGRHLFDFFAQEVLADLPADLRDFVLQCSVLPELTPTLCQAVTGRDDAHDILESLYRRNLFLSVLDESVPVLRFHDLFAEFLQTRLAQRHPGLAATLHARAAAAEDTPLRAVTHWLRAGEWDQAIALMGRCVEPLLAQGGQATVARWIAQLPEAIVRDDPDVAWLQALCNWARWDFVQVIETLERAARGFRAQGREERYMECLVRMPRAYNAVGRIERATQLLAEADSLSLPLTLRVINDGAHAWQMAAIDPAGCAAALERIITQAEQDADLLLPACDDMFNPFMFAMPGALPPMLRIRALCRRLLQEGRSHWQLEAMANTPWPELWRGERAAAEQAVERAAQMTQRLSVVPMLALNDNSVRGLLLAMQGEYDRGALLHDRNSEIFPANPGLQATWWRSSRFSVAHIYWMAGNCDAIEACWPTISMPHAAEIEWPYIATSRELLRGRRALLAGRHDEAEEALRDAVRLQLHWRQPNLSGDARLSLAALLLERGQKELALHEVHAVLQDALADDCVGMFLLESPRLIERLFALLPAAQRERPAVQAIMLRLAAWQGMPDGLAEGAAGRVATALDVLSGRELAVLARIAAGDSNKLIAREFDLSPHTVKRHVANILTKLDCATRGQAAAVWRATQS
ncbi:MAG TPA: LuxR C-terminal-related transcriptional regulator [Rhodocyclaceae bacterium]|nr:LuxR C-terminal-related transcriptional regulator [Rhodocyclaceae bacterium]